MWHQIDNLTTGALDGLVDLGVGCMFNRQETADIGHRLQLGAAVWRGRMTD